jgi:hypothetical protein
MIEEDTWFRGARVYLTNGEIVEHPSVAVMTPEGIYLRYNSPGRIFIPAHRVTGVAEATGYGWAEPPSAMLVTARHPVKD